MIESDMNNFATFVLNMARDVEELERRMQKLEASEKKRVLRDKSNKSLRLSQEAYDVTMQELFQCESDNTRKVARPKG